MGRRAAVAARAAAGAVAARERVLRRAARAGAAPGYVTAASLGLPRTTSWPPPLILECRRHLRRRCPPCRQSIASGRLKPAVFRPCSQPRNVPRRASRRGENAPPLDAMRTYGLYRCAAIHECVCGVTRPSPVRSFCRRGTQRWSAARLNRVVDAQVPEASWPLTWGGGAAHIRGSAAGWSGLPTRRRTRVARVCRSAGCGGSRPRRSRCTCASIRPQARLEGRWIRRRSRARQDPRDRSLACRAIGRRLHHALVPPTRARAAHIVADASSASRAAVDPIRPRVAARRGAAPGRRHGASGALDDSDAARRR